MNDIDKIFKDCKITQWGAVRARIFDERIKAAQKSVPFVSSSAEERVNPFLIMENARSIIVFLIPYRTNTKRSNLSDYAKGMDYHLVAKKISQKIIGCLNEKGYNGIGICDNGALDDRYLAYIAGLGIYGKNGLIINEIYGTYTFIAYIVTDYNIEKGGPLDSSCIGCGMCEKNCPGAAISTDGIDYNKCASYLTQKKGALSEKEKNIIKSSGYVWGCDLCQLVCPHNKRAEYSQLEEFSDNLIKEINDDGLSNKEFMHKYKYRAFLWRGAGIIRRNIEIRGN